MSNLLDKASIILTPTAYDNSEVLCVKPSDGSGDFDFSRNSAATRVNAQGLVEDVQILSSNLIVNGDFATNSNWNFNTGWSYETNKAVSVPSGGGKGINQSVGGKIFSGKTYKVKYTIQDYVSGNVRPSLSGGGTATGTTSNANGTFTQNLIATTNHTTFNIKSTGTSGGFNGSITNVSIIEISQDTNLPRINYDGFSFDGSGNIIPDSGCGSWLFEPQSTNLITYSEDFSNAAWTKLNVTITPNQGISPDGSNNASKYVGSTTSQDFRTPITFSSNYTCSCYIKVINSPFIRLRTNDGSCWFNMTTNAVATNTFADAEIKNVGNNWYRLSVTSSSFTSSSFFFIHPHATDNTTSELDGAEFLVWGAQVEEDYATSYIPTDGTSVTRNQDVCDNGGSLASINSTEGVLYAQIARDSNDGNFTTGIQISDGTTSNNLRLFFNQPNTISVITRVGGSNNIVKTAQAITSSTAMNKFALVWKLNDYKLYYNGAELWSDTSASVYPIGTLNVIDFKNQSNPFFGKTKCLAVFPFLTDTELAELTTI